MSLKLYELDDRIEFILANEVDKETGEITEETLARLEELELERDAKALAVVAYLKSEHAEADAIAAEADRLEQRARTHRNRAKRLEEYVAQHIEPGRKLSDARSAISWRKSSRVELDPGAESKLPERFVRVSVEPDKAKIRDALKAGEKIDGARLVERLSMQVK